MTYQEVEPRPLCDRCGVAFDDDSSYGETTCPSCITKSLDAYYARRDARIRTELAKLDDAIEEALETLRDMYWARHNFYSGRAPGRLRVLSAITHIRALRAAHAVLSEYRPSAFPSNALAVYRIR